MTDKFRNVILENGRYSIGIYVPDGISGIREISQSPSSLFAAGGGPQKYGDAEPGFAFMEQRTWEGGRGLDFFSDDPTRYNDSKGAWTLTPGKLGPAPQWFYARGYKTAEQEMPGNVTWRPLYEETLSVSRKISPANITADKCQVWIRRVGTPDSNLTFELCDDDGSGNPGSVLQTVTVDRTTITDILSVLHAFDWTGTQSLSAGTDYHIKLYGESTDTRDGHWEVAVDTAADGLVSEDGVSWQASEYAPYYRLTGVNANAYPVPFSLDGVRYFVMIYEDGNASKVYINGKRGKFTAASATTATDSGATFGTNSEYVGALVRIIRGTGKGQIRTIISHTNTQLTVATWKITPSTDSEYAVYLTDRFTEVATTGLGAVTDVAVIDNIANFAQGEGVNIRQMRYNPATPAHEFRDNGTNRATLLEAGYHSATPGAVLWRANNDTSAAGANTVSKAPSVTWGNNHSFGTAIKAGNGSYVITNILEGSDGANSRLFVFKSGENGFIQDDKWYRDNLNLSAFPEDTNGLAAIVHGLYKVFNWSWSLERQYGQALDDLDPNREAGFPFGRQGYISAVEAHPVGLILAIDAGDDGYSSVQFFDQVNYHEIFRAPGVGQRIRSLAWEPNPGGKKYLWIGCGDDIIRMEYPRNHRDPYKDDNQNFMHEFSLVSPVLDMGNSAIYKLWKEVSFVTQNLDGVGRKIAIDVKVGEDIGGSEWTTLDIGEIRQSPFDKVKFMLGQQQQLRYRIRGYTDDSMTPPIVNAAVVKGVGQLPIRFIVSFWGEFGPISDKLGAAPEEAVKIIADSAARASIWTVADSDYKRIKGRRVLASVNQANPEFNLNGRDESNVNIVLVQVDD